MLNSNILTTIGKTPLVNLRKIQEAHQLKATLLGKLEMFNPGGSIKDRIALSMIERAYQTGLITQNTVIIEPTSGNTGIGLAVVAAYYGNKLILVMPETMSMERKQLLEAFGATLVLTKGELGMKGSIAEAKRLAEIFDDSYIPSQFDNAANPDIHFTTTGPEIYQETGGEVDIFISSIGTGGTVTGAGKYLKQQNSKIQVIGVEPANSPFLSKGVKGKHKIQGIGAGFAPAVLDLSVIDEIIAVSDEDAYFYTKELVRIEGIFAGISSGAALAAAAQLAKRPENFNKKIAIIFPDSGDRYLSTHVFDGDLDAGAL
jgi:cysteine synthase A